MQETQKTTEIQDEPMAFKNEKKHPQLPVQEIHLLKFYHRLMMEGVIFPNTTAMINCLDFCAFGGSFYYVGVMEEEICKAVGYEDSYEIRFRAESFELSGQASREQDGGT